MGGVKTSLIGGVLPTILKMAVIQPLLKKPSVLKPSHVGKRLLVLNLPFLDKVIKSALASQMQRALDDTHCQDSFQSDFRAGFRTGMGLVALAIWSWVSSV